MRVSDFKYLAAYIVPLCCIAGLYFGGYASPGVIYFGFVIVPLLELVLHASLLNDDEKNLQRKSGMHFFDWLLYFNVPLVYGIVVYFVWLLAHRNWTTGELIFSIFNVGIFLGVAGINVAHELGHRQSNADKWLAKILLLPVLYSHFTVEHNYGHHLHVGTPSDPATAAKGQPIYTFFIRSITQGYRNAWRIGSKMLSAQKLSFWMHQMILSHAAQCILLASVFYYAGLAGLLAFVGAAIVGILTLESVNYIEHYGLVRKLLPSGRYEPMDERHSWNSDHALGRIVLFELVRHSDHHYQTQRKYQTLRHFDRSPQLPCGYPASILVALIPPLWFYIMHPRLDKLT